MAHRNRDRNSSGTSTAEQYLKGHAKEVLGLETSQKTKEIITHLKDYVQSKGSGITTSQLRNLFDRVKSIEKRKEANPLNKLQLLRPKMFYIAARQNKREAKEFIEFIDYFIQQVDTDEEVGSFIDFFEAIVAYHKYYNSK